MRYLDGKLCIKLYVCNCMAYTDGTKLRGNNVRPALCKLVRKIVYVSYSTSKWLNRMPVEDTYENTQVANVSTRLNIDWFVEYAHMEALTISITC